MNHDTRGIVYPLLAVHQRESWALDAAHAGMAAAAQRVETAAADVDRLRKRHGQVAAASTPVSRASIDPRTAQARLLYLSDLQHRLQIASQTHLALEQERERAREAVRVQQAKVESLECHRDAFLRAEASTRERLQGVEADRDWLARSQWRRAFAHNGGPMGGPTPAEERSR